MRHIRAYVERAETDPSGPLRVTAATEGQKADGLDLRMDRARLDRWRSNPVVLLEHFPVTMSANMPAVIGRADNIGVENDALKADVTFDTANPFAAEIDRQYRDGFLHAFSIGFDHGEVDSRGQPEWWEPVELSSVPVPMDTEALVDDDSRTHLVTAARAVLGDRDVAAELRQALAPQPPADREALPAHQTATDTDSDWDGPGEVSSAPNEAATLRHMHAWRDPDGDPDEKASYKIPHHKAGTDTAAVISGVNNALARLGQADIPDSDRDDVERHLRDHREDAGLDRGMSDPELRAALGRTAQARGVPEVVEPEPSEVLVERERQAGRSEAHDLRRRRLQLHGA